MRIAHACPARVRWLIDLQCYIYISVHAGVYVMVIQNFCSGHNHIISLHISRTPSECLSRERRSVNWLRPSSTVPCAAARRGGVPAWGPVPTASRPTPSAGRPSGRTTRHSRQPWAGQCRPGKCPVSWHSGCRGFQGFFDLRDYLNHTRNI